MSRRSGRKRKEDEALIANEDDDDERIEDKRSKVSGAAAAASSSSSSAAAAAASPARPQLAPAVAASSRPAATVAASSSSAAAAGAASSRPPAPVEDLLCSACLEAFSCEDDSARLPRLLPCGRHQLCSSCIVASIRVNPGCVHCPSGHGLLPISTAGVAAAALSSADDWMRLLPPFADFIAAIRNQHSLMAQIGEQRARCSHAGCESAVTDRSLCGDLCATHERKRHALALFAAYTQSTVPIALKAASLQSNIAGPAAAIRAHTAAAVVLQTQQLTAAVDELADLRARLLHKEQQAEARIKALIALEQTLDQMRAADDNTVLEMEADRLQAQTQHVRPTLDSTVLNSLDDDRVIALQRFLGAARDLSKAALLFRASRDGFKAKDWWRQCVGKSSLLTLVRVKGNGFVCGSFAPFQWPVDSMAYGNIADPTGATFLFSLVNAHNRAVKLRLKETRKANAGSTYPRCGPTVGDADFRLMSGGASADSGGNCAQPYSFEFDSAADGGAPIAYDKTLLAGDDGNIHSFVDFAAAEIESWQL